MGKIRGKHSSPGVYTKYTDLEYSVKTMGISALGLVGETEIGPAFEPQPIANWEEFRNMFGNTNATKFKDSQYPKYELPYIAKSYLKASDQLYVCRVLGLSGYKAGPAFVITGENDQENGKKTVIAVLRSRGDYKKYSSGDNPCDPKSEYDTLDFKCDTVTLKPYTTLSVFRGCNQGDSKSGETVYKADALNYGQFTIVTKKGNNGTEHCYPVSLNPGAKDYIFKVLGGDPTEGSADLFVEELYDLMLEEKIHNGEITKISTTVTTFNETAIHAVTSPVRDFVTIPWKSLRRSNLGQTFVYYGKEYPIPASGDTEDGFKYFNTNNVLTGMTIGHIYKVTSMVDKDGIKKYIYKAVTKYDSTTEQDVEVQVGELATGDTLDKVDAVYVLAYDRFFYKGKDDKSKDILIPLTDMCDYHESFRCASTPWIVSELKGDGKNVEVKKLFRFHTITDGDAANEQVKISIENIRPDEGLFDVVIRDFHDSDANQTILESYKNLTMVPGDPKYIGLKIGTLNGDYELVSKYVMVEVIENDMTAQCVPAGFLGYPVRTFVDASGNTIQAPTFTYNTIYDEDMKERRQYFGLSDLTGIDVDILNYKGKNAYTEDYAHGYTHPFHLDATLDKDVLSGITTSKLGVTIDGVVYENLIWDTVSPNNVTEEGKIPVIGTEDEMVGTIYENVKLRKFTVCPFGGFDGWDIYRKSRTNTNEYKANKYKGVISNGHGETFSKITNVEGLGPVGNCITSDYYAYLAGINQFENPEKFVINLFATPGIDYVNNQYLVDETIEMIEKRQDTFYVVTTPDKPWGASDDVTEMFTSAEAAANLDDSGVDTYYAGTYYPWVKFFDRDNNIYINLPATKDVLKNMANIDNKKYPWNAPAGLERGSVECKKLHFPAKIEDRDNVYDNRINPLIKFEEGVKVWGNKSMYISEDTNPMNRINSVRLMLYLRKLVIKSSLNLIFDGEDATQADEYYGILNGLLSTVKSDRGITDYRIDIKQTPEQMDLHEMYVKLWVKPTPVLEYIEIEFMVTPQGIQFMEL